MVVECKLEVGLVGCFCYGDVLGLVDCVFVL